MDYPTGKKSRKKWFYHIRNEYDSSNQLTDHGRAKLFLYENLYKNLTQHDIIQCYKLLQVLPKDTSLDPYILLRFVLILIESVDTGKVNKNFIIYLESLLSKLDLTKPDAFVEYLAYFIKNNRIDDARELFGQRHRLMTNQTHRKLPYLDINIRCYEFLMNYLSWEDRISEQGAIAFDVSIQGWLVNAIDQLKTITGNYEYFVMCITRVLITYAFYKKAYLFVSEFQINNPDNICAQLLLYNLLTMLANKYQLDDKGNQINQPMDCDDNEQEEVEVRMQTRRRDELDSINNFTIDGEGELIELGRYPIASHRNDILNNLRRLDKTRDEILELQYELSEDTIDFVRDLMDSLEYIRHMRDSTKWKQLKSILNDTIHYDDESHKRLRREIQHLWRTRYQRFWTTIDFLSFVENNPTNSPSSSSSSSSSSSLRRAMKKVLKIFRAEFGDHERLDESDVELTQLQNSNEDDLFDGQNVKDEMID